MAEQTTGAAKPGKIVRYSAAVARILFGLLFCMTGSNAFLDFMPKPPTLPDFAVAMAKTGYMFQLVGATQLLGGVLLLVNRFVPLGIVLLAPIVVNIVAFHIFLERSGLGLAIFVLLLEVFLAWAYRANYRGLFAAKATAGAA